MYQVVCGYISNYKVNQIYMQDDIYSYLFQKTLKKRNKRGMT